MTRTIGRWLRDRARTTPDRVAIDYDGRLMTYAELDAPLRGARGGVPGAWPRARRPRRDADGELAGARRRLLRLRQGGPDACSRSAGGWPPAELAYQLEDAEPALFLVEDAERASSPRQRAMSSSRLFPARRGAPKRGPPGQVPATTTRSCSSTPPGRPGGRRARCSRTRTASGRTCASTSRPASAATTSCSRCCRSSTSAAGTSSRCSRGGRARASCSSAAFDAGRACS